MLASSLAAFTGWSMRASAQAFHGVRKSFFIEHHKLDDIPSASATKAIPFSLIWIDKEGGGIFFMKRAESYKLFALGLELDAFPPDHLDQLDC